MLAVVAFMAVFVGTIVSVWRAVRRPKPSALDQAAVSLVDAHRDESAHTVTGTRHGVRLTVGVGDGGLVFAEAGTEDDLVLSVHPRGHDEGAPDAANGDALSLDDPAFEDAFAATGAPAAAARRVLDAAARARLRALAPITLEARDGHLRLERPGLGDDAAAVADLVDLCALAAARPARAESLGTPPSRPAPPERGGWSLILMVVGFSVVVVTTVVLIALSSH